MYNSRDSKAKEKYLEEKCKDIEVYMRTGNRDAAYKLVNNAFND